MLTAVLREELFQKAYDDARKQFRSAFQQSVQKVLSTYEFDNLNHAEYIRTVRITLQEMFNVCLTAYGTPRGVTMIELKEYTMESETHLTGYQVFTQSDSVGVNVYLGDKVSVIEFKYTA